MNARLQDARNHLFWCRARVAQHRRIGQLNSNDVRILREVEQDFFRALDLVWARQCEETAQ